MTQSIGMSSKCRIKNLLTVAGGGPFNNYNAASFKADPIGGTSDLQPSSLYFSPLCRRPCA